MSEVLILLIDGVPDKDFFFDQIVMAFYVVPAQSI